ncbi:MAG: CHC2 zinc finger domain-containing protein, partial [Pirellula sp.]
MSFAIDNEVKDRVRLATSIVDLMSGYTELRRQGRNFVCVCPFHDDRRPSLQINPDR